MASSIYGRVGGVIDGLSIHCATGPNFIRGRIGGDVFGADLDLHVDAPGGTVTGRMGGAIIGRSVDVRYGAGSIYGRVGGAVDGNDLSLSGTERISGRCGGAIIGFDCDLKLDGMEMTGRLGGAIIGKSVAISISTDLPPILSALVAVLTYYHYLVNTRNRGSGGSSGRGK
ncbi:MAG: hypothetical protein WCZ48_03640 [Bacillota bacterium]|jgi:hypothetical protein|nr:hypothetical protein [Bacillota bacterium]